MNSSVVERFIKTMDDDTLRFYLKDHRKMLVINEKNYRNSLDIVEELEHEADKRGLTDGRL